MKKWFSLPKADQRDLIRVTAGRMKMDGGIIEKDLWLLAVLNRIFNSEIYGNQFIFKGGTSLSKVFDLIQRFSEDIDLIMNWELLGYSTENANPWEQRSRTRQDRFNKEMNALADEYLATTFAPWLQEELLRLTALSVPVLALGEGKLEVQYPATFSVPYVRNTILLEIGPLASWIPSTRKGIRTYISDYFPQILEEQTTMVRVTTAERTFWEKATIAHQIVHNEKTPPPRYSRHYYDLYMLIINGIGESALGDLDLLQSVAVFKDRFYPSPRARYDLASPGTLRLVPNKAQQKALKDDYAGMGPMFFRDPPKWDDIIRELQELENSINENIKRSPHAR